MTFTQFLSMIAARWRLALGLLSFVMAATLAVSLLLPRQYTATASVYVDGKAAAVDPMAGIVLPGVVSTGFITTQADLLRSERVMRRAVRNLGLNHNAELHATWLKQTQGVGDFEAWEAEFLGRKLEVKPSRESSVIALEYTGRTPGFAAGMANAVVKAYIDTTLEMRVEPARQYRAFFEQRARHLRAALDEAQKKLLDYQSANGLMPVDDKGDVESARLAELTSQLVATQALAAESNSRQAQAKGQADKMQEVMNSPVVSALTADLIRQEARYEELTQQYGAGFPQVQDLGASIARLKSRIESETRRVSSGIGVSGNINRNRVAQLSASIEAQRGRMLELKAKRDEAALLAKDVDSAKSALDAVQSRINQTELESQNTQTNVSVVKQASAPSTASSPAVLRNLSVALVMGALLGVGAAFAAEMGDARMRTEHDVVVSLKQPLLAVLPTALSTQGVKKGLLSRRLLPGPGATPRLT